MKTKREMICLQYFYNIFTTNLKWQGYWLLLLGQKSNLSVRFKFKLITINHQWFVVKILWKYCGCNIFQDVLIVLLLGFEKRGCRGFFREKGEGGCLWTEGRGGGGSFEHFNSNTWQCFGQKHGNFISSAS